MYKSIVAIHNKNGKGLLPVELAPARVIISKSQSTIKMEKGYYRTVSVEDLEEMKASQSTIKMEKGYYKIFGFYVPTTAFQCRNPQ